MATHDRSRHCGVPAATTPRRPGDGSASSEDLLDRLGIGQLADRKPAQLSGGEQQRVGLGRALARQAMLYLFDEPTAHLDAHLQDVFLGEIAARQREMGAAAVTQHDAAEALGLADRVAVLVGGRVIQVGTPQQLYVEPVSATAARLTGPASILSGPDRYCWCGPIGCGSVVIEQVS